MLIGWTSSDLWEQGMFNAEQAKTIYRFLKFSVEAEVESPDFDADDPRFPRCSREMVATQRQCRMIEGGKGDHPSGERVGRLTHGSGPGLIATGSPGVAASGQVGEFEEAGIELSHLAQINDERILLEDVLAVQELPGAIVFVMRDQQQFRLALKDALERDDLGALVVGESPTGVHVRLPGS